MSERVMMSDRHDPDEVDRQWRQVRLEREERERQHVPARPLGESRASRRCPMCGGAGWVLDCNDLNKPGSRMIEFLPCLLPDCEVSGRPVQSLCFKGIEFTSVALHPSTGAVMSVSVRDQASG